MTRFGILTRSTWLAHAGFVLVLAASMWCATIDLAPAVRPAVTTRRADDSGRGLNGGPRSGPFVHAILNGWDAQPNAPIIRVHRLDRGRDSRGFRSWAPEDSARRI